jgi:hypothetical protein
MRFVVERESLHLDAGGSVMINLGWGKRLVSPQPELVIGEVQKVQNFHVFCVKSCIAKIKSLPE